MEEICVDLLGPFPESRSGNKWVVVIVDSFTRWMEAYPIPNKEAKTVAEQLVMQFMSRFGVPYWIKSDQGREFEGVFAAVCELLGAEHRTSTAYHPQGNSNAERMVKVVRNLINAYCQDQTHWDEKLPLLTLAYRSAVHEVTGYTPNYLTFGREVYLPMDLMVKALPEGERQTAPEYVQDLKGRLADAFVAVRNACKSYGERQKRRYDLRSRGRDFQPGDLVYVMEKAKKLGVCPKLSPQWRGPFVIVQKCGTVFEVMVSSKKSKLLHADLISRALKQYKLVRPRVEE